MRVICAIAALGLLSSCVETEPKRPILEPPFSGDFVAEKARELREARKQPSVSRTFLIGWEMHHGYYLMAPGNEQEFISVDFADASVLYQFDEFVAPGRGYGRGEPIPNEGKLKFCQCIGVEWSFYNSKQFLVRSAKFEARP